MSVTKVTAGAFAAALEPIVTRCKSGPQSRVRTSNYRTWSKRGLSGLAFASLLTGCMGGALTPTQGSYASQPSGVPAATLGHPGGEVKAHVVRQIFFVADLGVGSVGAVETLKKHSGKNVGEITNGIHGPLGTFVDRHHNLYVANTGGNDVTEYKRGTTSPSFTYSSGLRSPAQVAVDKHDNVYVADESPASDGEVVEYAQGSNTILAECPEIYNSETEGISVDNKGDVFVGIYEFPDGGRIAEYAGGLSNCNPTILPVSLGSDAHPIGIAIDDKHNLIVSTEITVNVIPPPYSNVTASLGGFSYTKVPLGISLTRNNKMLYIATIQAYGSNFIEAITYPDGRLVGQFGDGIVTPESVAVDPDATR